MLRKCLSQYILQHSVLFPGPKGFFRWPKDVEDFRSDRRTDRRQQRSESCLELETLLEMKIFDGQLVALLLNEGMHATRVRAVQTLESDERAALYAVLQSTPVSCICSAERFNCMICDFTSFAKATKATNVSLGPVSPLSTMTLSHKAHTVPEQALLNTKSALRGVETRREEEQNIFFCRYVSKKS